jgi:hypothetical protein
MPVVQETSTFYMEKTFNQGRNRVLLEDIGEGLSGDYDPDDPTDTPLLRFSIDERNDVGEWCDVNNASYCTQLPATINEAMGQYALDYIIQNVANPITSGTHKRICEKLSWLSPEALT